MRGRKEVIRVRRGWNKEVRVKRKMGGREERGLVTEKGCGAR